jgi:hypothetical protein
VRPLLNSLLFNSPARVQFQRAKSTSRARLVSSLTPTPDIRCGRCRDRWSRPFS